MGSYSLIATTQSRIHSRPTTKIIKRAQEYVDEHPGIRIKLKRLEPRDIPKLNDYADATEHSEIRGMSIQEGESIEVIVSGNGSKPNLKQLAEGICEQLEYDYKPLYIKDKN